MAINKLDYQHLFLPLFSQAEQHLTDENIGIHSEAFQDYLALWEEIAQKTADLDNMALQDVVLLFVDASSQAFKDANQLTPQHHQLLQKWHLLFKNYIHSPEDENAALALIQCLNAAPLAMELTEQDERVLLAGFIPVIENLTHNAVDDIILSNITSLSTWEQIAPVFDEADVILQDILTADLITQPQFLIEHLNNYQLTWTKITQLVEYNNDAIGLFDSLLLFNALCQQLTTQDNPPTYEQLALLKRWHNLFASYTKTRGSVQMMVALIKCLTHPSWPQAISSAEEKKLLATIGIVNQIIVNSATPPELEHNAVVPNIATQSEIELVTADTEIDLTETAIWQTIKPLFDATMVSLTTCMTQQQENDSAILKLALQQYVEQWLIIAQELQKQRGYDGLLDVIFLYIEIGSQAFKNLANFERKNQVLSTWQQTFASYLQTSGHQAQTLAWALIKCLSNPVWGDAAITAEDEQMLADGFVSQPPVAAEQDLPAEITYFPSVVEPEITAISAAIATAETPLTSVTSVAIEPEIFPVFETAPEITPEIKHLPAIIEPEITTISDDPAVELIEIDEQIEAILGLDFESEGSEDEFEELDELDEIVNFAIPDFSLAEEYSDIWQELESVFKQAESNLQTVFEAQQAEDSSGFHFDLQCYLENWQEIADILARDERYLGFADMVLLFVEMSIHSFVQQTQLTDQQIQLLKQWQYFFSDYFTHYEQQSALSLLQCLSDSSWAAAAITEADQQLLLEGLHLPAILTPTEKIAELFTNTQQQIQTMVALLSINNAQACTVALHAYAQNWTTIAQLMASEDDAQLYVVADVSLLFVEGCSHWQQHPPLTDSDVQLMQAWQAAFADYLATADILPLISCLENPHWAQPLTAMDRQLLLEAAKPENDEHLQVEQEIIVINQDSSERFTSIDTAVVSVDEQQMQSLSPEADFASTEDFVAESVGEEAFIEAFASPDDESLEIFEEAQTELVSPELDAVPPEDLAEKSADEEALYETFVSTDTPVEPLIEEQIDTVSPEVDFPQTEDFAAESANPVLEFTIAVESIDPVDENRAAASIAIPDMTAETEDNFAPLTQAQIQLEPISIVPEPVTIEDLPDLQELLNTIEPTHVNLELVNMVRDEFDNLVTEFNTEISLTTTLAVFRDVVNSHQFKMQSLAKACQTVGLLGLEKVFTQLSLNMRSRRESDPDFSQTEANLFTTSLPLIQDYLKAINDINTCTALVNHLAVQGWRIALTPQELNPLIALLVSPQLIGGHKEALENRKTTATLADVSLKMPEDVNRDLLDALLSELPVLTSNFSAVIQRIIFMAENDVQQLLDAQRIAHTLKGSGNIVGVSGIAVLTHHLEEILEYLTEHKKFPTKSLGNILLESADCLEMMCELMLNGEQQAPEQALDVLQNVLNWANQIAAQGLPADDAELITTTVATIQNTPVVEAAKAAEPVAMLRVPSELVDSLLRATGEGSILSEQFKDKIGRFSEELKNLNGLTWHIQSLVAELDQFINIQSYTASKSNRRAVTPEFDALEMEQYNELHTAASRIAEVATDIRETTIGMEEQLIDLRYLMIEENNLQRENQDRLQSIRMVPASTIASRCQRIVRQACRATNKEVELDIKGADILIDSEILNDMVDPLMHLLRNSVDHGIEPLHIREKLNKNKVGKITLEFKRKGNYAVISCKDDGSGLASGAILQTAIRKGLISADQELTEAEIHKLILIPGFSTRAVVTQTSGRGIGMDAIQTKISSIQGQMSLVSVRGEGLTIDITIPLTLSSMLSLLVKCNGQTMAISNRGLRKIYHADDCTLVQVKDHLWCDIDYERYAAKYFAELVGMPVPVDINKKLPAVRIEDEIGKIRIVFIDELLGYRDLLVKHMGSYIPHIQGVTGASILGNGDVAPVIDLVEMLHHAAKYDYVIPDASKALADNINGLPIALVVDDSLSARRAVATLLKDSGIRVETAIDGLDAIKQIEKIIPDLLVVDLEMPRMNGIELAAHIRGREDMRHTPIIMITSRATEKHRKQAEAAGVSQFMTKPFTEDDLIHQVRLLLDANL